MLAGQHLDPTVMDVLAAVSTRSSTAPTRPPMSCWLANADTSDAPAQPVADTVSDHGAEALGALTDFLTEISRELRATASAPATFHIAKSRYSSTDGSCAGPRPSRERAGPVPHTPVPIPVDRWGPRRPPTQARAPPGPPPRRPCPMLAVRRGN